MNAESREGFAIFASDYAHIALEATLPTAFGSALCETFLLSCRAGAARMSLADVVSCGKNGTALLGSNGLQEVLGH